MITTFRRESLELFLTNGSFKGIHGQYGAHIERMLDRLDALKQFQDKRKAMTAEMAIRVARAVGGSPQSWIRMQVALDLWAELKFKNNPGLAPKALAA
jgi:hypothetical protein